MMFGVVKKRKGIRWIAVAFSVLMLLMPGYSVAQETSKKHIAKYEIRADGLACPYCAYGIEKKFMAVKGVKHVDVDLESGKVLVSCEDKLDLTEQQLKTLFSDAGFTFRSIKPLSDQHDGKK